MPLRQPEQLALAASCLALPPLVWLLWRFHGDTQANEFAIGLLITVLLLAAILLGFAGVQRRGNAGDALYQDMFEQAHMPRLLVDAVSGDLLQTNQAASNLFCLSRKRLLRKTLYELLNIHPGQLPHSPDQGQLKLQLRHTSALGEEQELHINLVPLARQAQHLLLVDLEDTSEHQRFLAELTESREKLEAILDASTDGIVLTDERGDIQLFSPAAEMMFGFLKEELLGRPLKLLMPKDCANGPGSWIPSGVTEGYGTVREIMGERRDGGEIPLRVSLNRVTLGDQCHYLALIQDLTEQMRNQQRLAYMERYDLLTDLLNRAEFERRLDTLLSFSKPLETEYVLCHIDVDQFKVVNDTCGHAAGDLLLKQLAILIRSHLPESTIIARTGGDEFGVLLPDCTVARAEDICGGLQRTVRNFLFTWRDRSYVVAVSIGIAGFRPQAEQVPDALSRADVACHMAKRLGRDRLYIYHQGDADLIRHHGDMHLVSTINQALSEGRFHLYAQPISPISAATSGERKHYEVLVRMVDEHGRLVIPEKFIPAAERYILMPAIDRWVIGSLFSLQAENMRCWADSESSRGYLFGVNLSGTSLTDDGFLSYLKRQFKEHRVPFQAICFEITETAAVANLEKARAMIDELKELGCSFALDDFGTGLSSYAYLKLLPVDYLKIDGGFVRNMTQDPVDYAMVDSINHIGHILGLKTIAEWAETPGTLTQLRAINVDYAQGYGVGDMISVENFQLEVDMADISHGPH